VPIHTESKSAASSARKPAIGAGEPIEPPAIAAQGASLIVSGAYLCNGTTSLGLAGTLEFAALVGCIRAAARCLREDRDRRLWRWRID
jgi:hypothetical protein